MAPKLFYPFQKCLFLFGVDRIEIVVGVAVPRVIIVIPIVVGARILLKANVLCDLVFLRGFFAVISVVGESLLLSKIRLESAGRIGWLLVWGELGSSVDRVKGFLI